ncbi:hypothetical protein CXF68_15815 [Tenacibaculum sp. Bg11-29]|uniref:hypothetical protein n=1 Tax=Tenacibaculum sp. Bg11-29 TaxID=2058306 RepID=UPI000C342D2A|nr:hypothetical protein [Tenacibaculum sp. Bg11-29]PKH52070.1 hypothetical protein CXF68_15815 [Tenacibaculum sp. Bg11-29]
MKKTILLTLIILGIITCSNNNDNTPKTVIDDGVNQNLLTYQISNSNVFSTTPEQVKNASFNTITLKEGFITSKLTSRLGKFEEAKKLDLNLQITRQTKKPKFEVGSFSLAGPEIIINAFISPKNTTFAVINSISIKEYQILKSLDKLEELKDKFVFHPNSDNKLIIEKVEDRKELENDATGNYKIGSQLLEGYALIYLMEINSNEIFSIRLDFSLINDIRLRM